jgi:HEPN domain-containing protein
MIWLHEARYSLEDARFALERARWSLVTFLAHQAVEKALKALWIHVRREPPPRTHVLPELLPEGVDVGADVEDLYWLSKYYTVSRYPDAAGGPPSMLIVEWEARRALEVASKVVSRVEELLRDP